MGEEANTYLDAHELLTELESLKYEICVDLGFCGSPFPIQLKWIVKNCPLTSSEFADEVLLKEKTGPVSKYHIWLRERFERRFGKRLNPGPEVRKKLALLMSVENEYES